MRNVLSRRQSRKFSVVSVLTVGLLLAGCSSEPEDNQVIDPNADTSIMPEPEQPVIEPDKDDQWDTLDDKDRCRMVIEQFPEVDPNARVDIEDFILQEPLDDLTPHCIYETDQQGALPTQVSIFLDAETGLLDDMLTSLESIGFEAFNQSPTLVNMQSQYAPGSIRIENWEAEALLEPYVNSYDLKGKYLVIMTANYSPDFDPELLLPNDTGSFDDGDSDPDTEDSNQ